MLLTTRTRSRPRVDARLASYGVLGAGALAVALVAALTGLQVTIHSLDETVYKFAAVQHANDVPFGVFHEHTSRGVARLFSLLVSPFFDLFAGDVAIRMSRALNSVLFAATAVPVAFLARRVTTSPWSATAAGLLSVAVPWLTLATIMFSESLAYLLFACAVLAMVRALEAPGWGRDLMVVALLVALVFTRVQFVVLLPAWALIVLVAERRRWRQFPVTVAGTALALGGALVLLAVGVFSGRLRDLAGPYYEIIRRDGVPGNFGLAFLWEVEMLSVGVGLLPVVLAAPWYAFVLGRRKERPGFRFAAVVLTALGVLFAATLWAQGGFLEWRSEERYFIYAIPFIWIGAIAAVERRDLPRGWIAASGVALLFVLLTVPITANGSGEQVFLGLASMTAAHLLPRLEQDLSDLLGLAGAFTPRDVLGFACVLVAGLAFVLWRRGARARRWALVPAIALQLFVASYAFAGVYGKLDGIGGLTPDIPFADLGWVDRATPDDPAVRLLDNQSEGREGAQRNTVFWNDEVTSLYRLGPANVAAPGFPVFTLPTAFTDVRPEDLRLTSELSDYAVTAVDSPLWQVAGEVVRESPDGLLALIRPADPAQATWTTQGLDTDGQVVREVTVSALGGRRVTIEAAAPDSSQESGVRIELGDADEELRFGPGRPSSQRFSADLCDATGPVQGRIQPVNSADIGNNRFSGARMLRVRLEAC